MEALLRRMLDEQRQSIAQELARVVERLATVEDSISSLRRIVDERLEAGEDVSSTGGTERSSAAPPGVPPIPRAPSSAPAALAPQGSVPLASDMPISSFELGNVAAAWDSHKEIKLRELPRLGKGKDEMPYGRWKYYVLAALDAARLTPVLRTDFPEGEPPAVQEYYRAGNAVLFAALLTAVKDISVLGDIILRLYGDASSARKAWNTIKGHFVRPSDNNETYLLKKLQELKPGDTESMESLLNRCARLRNEFAEYGLVLQDKLLITQVLGSLSIQWKDRAGLKEKDLSSLSWGEVALALQAEDNARRQSNTKSPEALLPLGWTRRTAGEARPAAGGGESPGKSPSFSNPSTASAAPASGPPRGPWNSSQGAKKEGETHVRVPVVCWHCQKNGHTWTECTEKPSNWRPSQKDRDKGNQARLEMVRRREQSQKDKAAHASKASGTSASSGGAGPSVDGRSSDARASGAL